MNEIEGLPAAEAAPTLESLATCHGCLNMQRLRVAVRGRERIVWYCPLIKSAVNNTHLVCPQHTSLV